MGGVFHSPANYGSRGGLSASLPVTTVTLPVTETAAAGGARLEGQRLVESGLSVLTGFVIGINRN